VLAVRALERQYRYPFDRSLTVTDEADGFTEMTAKLVDPRGSELRLIGTKLESRGTHRAKGPFATPVAVQVHADGVRRRGDVVKSERRRARATLQELDLGTSGPG